MRAEREQKCGLLARRKWPRRPAQRQLPMSDYPHEALDQTIYTPVIFTTQLYRLLFLRHFHVLFEIRSGIHEDVTGKD